MDYVRIGGACLLLMLLAAALPADVLAQAPQPSSGAAPSISQSLLSGSSADESSISAETLSRRNTGLKPLGSGGSRSSTLRVGSAASTPSEPSAATAQTSAAPAVTAAQVASAPAAAQPVAASATPSQVSSEPVQTAASSQTGAQAAETTSASGAESTGATDTPISAEIVTPDQIEQDTAATATTTAAATTTASTATATESETEPESTETTTESASGTSGSITPPEDVDAGTVVSGIDSVSNETETENASEDESLSDLADNNQSENETEEDGDETGGSGSDRIWREGISSNDFTWTPQTFSGFFYDLENDVGTEELRVILQPEESTIESGNLQYSTSPEATDFEFEDWGEYQVVGFMAEKYFAGYLESDLIEDDRSLISDGELRRVLVDSDEDQTITTGSVLPLEEGYELRIKQIDIDGNKVYMALAKDGDEIDSKVVDPGGLESSTYTYEVEIEGEDTPIVLAHIANVFASTESALVTVDGLFQISDEFTPVEDGDEYGRMSVETLTPDEITMENEDSINLRRGSTVEIFGDVSFLVADDDELRFAPFVDKIGSYDVRGTVIDPSDESDFTWTPYNFEGFYYDIDEDIGTETMTITISDNSKIEEGDLKYETVPKAVDFESDDWGKYDVIGFMADKYFAGYNSETEFTDEVSVISEGELRRVLLDSDDSRTIASGSVLSLEEGYELRIKQVDLNGNKVYLALARDGEELDSKVVTPSSDPTDDASNYLYEIEMGTEDDVPLIAAHVESVFRSTESDLATVDAVFQISDTPESVEEGEVHGKLEVDSLDADGVTLSNDDTINLAQGKSVEIMDNLRFDVADNERRLTAPIATKTSEGIEMSLTVSEAVVDRPVTIRVRSGTEPVSRANILVDGNSIGSTDATGSISYTPESTGTVRVVARKTGYSDASADLVVRSSSGGSDQIETEAEEENATTASQLILNAPAEVASGENFLITITEGINQTPVAGADILLDGASIGDTGSQGTLTYSINATGEHSLEAEKEGFESASRDILVTSSLKVINLTLPERAYVGQNMRVSGIVQNSGSQEDTITLDLMVNGTLVESKNVTVDAGENSTVQFSYEPEEPGLHTFSLDGITETIDVEEAQSRNWLIALILILLIAIGAGYYLYRTGELDKLQRQVRKMQGR